MSDTYYYKRVFFTLQASFGEMKTGVQNGGMVVYNSKDLEKERYSFQAGYYFTRNLIMNINYAIANYKEYLKSEDAKKSTALFSLSYRY